MEACCLSTGVLKAQKAWQALHFVGVSLICNRGLTFTFSRLLLFFIINILLLISEEHKKRFSLSPCGNVGNTVTNDITLTIRVKSMFCTHN